MCHAGRGVMWHHMHLDGGWVLFYAVNVDILVILFQNSWINGLVGTRCVAPISPSDRWILPRTLPPRVPRTIAIGGRQAGVILPARISTFSLATNEWWLLFIRFHIQMLVKLQADAGWSRRIGSIHVTRSQCRVKWYGVDESETWRDACGAA